MIKKILKGLLAVLTILIAIILFKTFTFESQQPDVATMPAPELSGDELKHLQSAITYKTISYTDTTLFDTAQFNGFHRFLKNTYPLVHEKLELKVLAGHSLLYKWTGADASTAPYVLMAHQDVVPIEEASRSLWTVAPFEGVVKDDFIWGRGTTDDKINLIGIMESVEKLLKENFQPKRTIYLAFGHDEEVGGFGARTIANYLKSENVRPDLVLDEGGIVTRNQVPGMTKPVALIGNSEKGYLSLELKVEKPGGHSSMPAKETAVDILSAAILKIRQHPFPANFSPSTEGFITHVGPEMPFVQKMVFANTWLFKKVVIGIYEGSPGGNALVRTTSVPTIINAGVKDNVVPTSATAVVNFRLLTGDSSGMVIAKVKELINDERVTMSRYGGFVSEPTGISPADGPGFRVVQETARKTFDHVVTTPFIMLGGSDSRFMNVISDNIIKFSPMIDPVGFHGIDERVSLESYQHTIWFFEQLLRSAK